MDVVTYTKAKQWARHLHEWGYLNVRVIEHVPQSTVYVKCTTPANAERLCRTLDEFKALRDAAATREAR